MCLFVLFYELHLFLFPQLKITSALFVRNREKHLLICLEMLQERPSGVFGRRGVKWTISEN